METYFDYRSAVLLIGRCWTFFHATIYKSGCRQRPRLRINHLLVPGKQLVYVSHLSPKKHGKRWLCYFPCPPKDYIRSVFSLEYPSLFPEVLCFKGDENELKVMNRILACSSVAKMIAKALSPIFNILYYILLFLPFVSYTCLFEYVIVLVFVKPIFNVFH